MAKRPAFTVENFAKVQHDPKGVDLFGEILADHHQAGCITVPAGTRVVISRRKGDEATVVFPHDVLNARKLWSDGDLRVVKWNNLKIIGRFTRKNFSGI